MAGAAQGTHGTASLVIQYDPKKHQMLALKWFLDLQGDQRELDNLFAKPLHNLTAILYWMSHQVSFGFELDEGGIWAAAWVEPCLSGAYFGAWTRKSKRHTKAALRFINQAYEIALGRYPVICGVTCQPELHKLHIKLGYIYGCTIPGFFEGKDAMLFYMTRESRDGRFERRHVRQNGEQHQQLGLRAPVSEHRDSALEHGEAGGPADNRANGRGAKDRRRKQPNSGHKRSHGVRARKPESEHHPA